MEAFNRALAVRLRTYETKYLTACEDKETVELNLDGSSKKSYWAVVKVIPQPNLVVLKSCYSGKYLSASNVPYLPPSEPGFCLGAYGNSVIQSSQIDSSVAWEPIKEGSHVKLRTRNGNLLRGLSGVGPDWENSVMNDFPPKCAKEDGVLWIVDLVEPAYQSVKDEAEDNKNVNVEDSYEVNPPDSAPIRFRL